MSLSLIGTGISFDLTLLAIEELKHCNEVYIESYTSYIDEKKIVSLERLIGKRIQLLERSTVESDFLIKKAKDKRIALLSSGDPLTATTHISLLLDAKKVAIDTLVIHNSSIYTAAAGRVGLQIYKFGRTATIPTPRPHYRPTSWFDIIKENLLRGCHTLVLLDTEPQPMDAKVALGLIEALDKDKLIDKLVVLSMIGEKDERITFGKIEDLKKIDLGNPPSTLIIPGKLHPVEEDFLKQFVLG